MTAEEYTKFRFYKYQTEKQNRSKQLIVDTIVKLGGYIDSVDIQAASGISIAHTRTLLNKLLADGRVSYELVLIERTGGYRKMWSVNEVSDLRVCKTEGAANEGRRAA